MAPVASQPETRVFPLLDPKLPPELRNMIYSHALGGRVLHIGLRKRDKTLYLDHLICRPKASDDEAAQLFRSENKNVIIDFATNRHERCKAEGANKQGSRLDLGLLRTCRQVYQEAGLYIYAENTFSFGDAFYPIGNPFNPTWHFRAFDRFIESLTPRKRINIRNIILTRHRPFSDITQIFPSKLRNITSLRSLRSVTVMLEMLDPVDIAKIYLAYRDNVVTNISRFTLSPWFRSLRICIYSPQYTRFPSIREWCADREKEILEEYQSVRRQERVKAQKEMQKQDETVREQVKEVARHAQNTQKREARGLRTLKRKFSH